MARHGVRGSGSSTEESGGESAGLSANAEPTVPVRAGWIAAFSCAWLGLWMAQLVPMQVLLPLQLLEQHPSEDWLWSLVSFGMVTAIAGVFTIVAYPVVGALSDRTVSRFGRRRPWILLGMVLVSSGLGLLSLQRETLGTIVFWTITTIGFCIATAALTAVLADKVPEGQRGLVSGWVSAPNALGILLGMVLVTAVFTTTSSGYLCLAAAVLICGLPFLVVLHDLPLTRREVSKLPRMSGGFLLHSLWVDPRRHPDFGWTVTSRVLINFSNAIATTMLLYFFTFALRLSDPTGFLVTTTVVYMAITVVASILFGKLSDMLGRRRIFVLASGSAQAFAAIILAVSPTTASAIVGAVLLGLGQGCFFAVDQALATQVLPSAESRGKDVGIMNIALAVPQSFGPLVGAGAVMLFGGFTGLFVVSGVIGLLGSAAIMRVQSVR